MDFDMFGMGDFSSFDMGCEILIIGPIDKEKGFTGESVWQSTVLSPFGYEVSIADFMENEEDSKWLFEESRKIGVTISKDILEDARKCKVISVNGLYHEKQMDICRLKQILEEGKKNQAVICVDPGKIEDPHKAMEILKEIAPHIDYFLPNEEEAKKLTNQTIAPMIAQDLRDLGIKTVVMKTGMNGCFVRGEEAPFAMGAIWGEKKDLTGVGANFVAGLIYGLFQDWQMKTVCEFATGCAAVSAGYDTPVEGAKFRKDEIKKILNNPYM